MAGSEHLGLLSSVSDSDIGSGSTSYSRSQVLQSKHFTAEPLGFLSMPLTSLPMCPALFYYLSLLIPLYPLLPKVVSS